MRSRTALTAGRLRDAEASIYLPVLLSDPDPAVRRAAAFAAGISADRRLVRFLVASMADPDARTAAAAATALGRLGGDDAFAALAAVVSSPGDGPAAAGASAGPPAPLARAAAARSLFRFPERSLVPLLGPWVDLPTSPEVCRAAVYALARSPRPDAAPALREALRLGDRVAVAWAARGLGLLADREAEAALERLARSADDGVAIQALLALERLAPRGGLPTGARGVALARSDEARPGVAIAALTTLRKAVIGDDEAVRLLRRIAAGGGRRGAVALASLAALSPGDAEAVAFPPGDTAPEGLRLGACEALGLVPDERAAAWGERLLADPAVRVRMEAVSRLPKAVAARHPRLLAAALADVDLSVRAAALGTAAPLLATDAGKVLDSPWNAALRTCLSSGDADAVATALEAAADRPVVGPDLLRARADDPDALVRTKARRLLIDRFGADPASFRPIPVATRRTPSDDRRLAEEAAEATFTATVTTRRGTVEMELLPEEAPMTVASFVSLARRGFFDGTVIHRVVPDFVVQAGDPRGDGTGGPGYALRDELNAVPYERGTVGMALSGPDTGGSQWFVALSPQPHLDGAYTVFARVTAGMDVADRIEQDDGIVSITVREGRRPRPPEGLEPPP